jgi:plastocyanin
MLLLSVVPSFAQDSSTQTIKNAAGSAVTGVENLAPREITITATDFKFSPSEFAVAPGRKLKITLVNNGKSAHNIQFDLPDNNKVKISQDVAPKSSGTLEFTAPGPGTFSFKCPVDLHSTFGMHGKMIVQQ